MADIVERLREHRMTTDWQVAVKEAHEGADEIASLRAEVEKLTRRVEWFTHGVHTCHDECDRPLCKTTRDRDALRATNARLVEALQDPASVHINMLRGVIAKPTLAQIIHLYGGEALSAALAGAAKQGDGDE